MSAPTMEVDATAGVVRAGSLAWPFEIDLKANAAIVGLDGRRFRLRPLLWREKLRLARFAHLGLSWIKRHFLQLALAGDAALPEGETEREVLWTLALWLNDPAGEAGLALNPAELAAATVAVCQGAGLKPADLDDRDALEVEALWRAARGPAPEVEADDEIRAPALYNGAAQTRIVVLPDPVIESTEAGSTAVAPAAQGGATAMASGDEHATTALAHALPVEPRTVEAVPGRARMAERETRGLPPASREPAPARRRFSEFRVVFPDANAPPAPEAATPRTSEPRLQRIEPEGIAAAQDAPLVGSRAWAPTGPFKAMAEGRMWAPSDQALTNTAAPASPPFVPADDAPFTGHGVVEWIADPLDLARPAEGPLLEAAAEQQVSPPRAADSAGRVTLDHIQQDALFEALTERLEQAAAELGIDIQG